MNFLSIRRSLILISKRGLASLRFKISHFLQSLTFSPKNSFKEFISKLPSCSQSTSTLSMIDLSTGLTASRSEFSKDSICMRFIPTGSLNFIVFHLKSCGKCHGLGLCVQEILSRFMGKDNLKEKF